MTITNYAVKSNDIIFFERGYGFKAEDSKYCIFGIDFDEVASYSIEETTWKDDSPAISIFITLEKEKEYILMRKAPNPEKILSKIINPDKIEGFCEEYSAEYDEMIPKYGKVDPDVDLKYIFDLIVYG
jgi:hypothetical protein